MTRPCESVSRDVRISASGEVREAAMTNLRLYPFAARCIRASIARASGYGPYHPFERLHGIKDSSREIYLVDTGGSAAHDQTGQTEHGDNAAGNDEVIG